MRTRVWTAAVWSTMALGCTTNTISLDDAGTGAGTETDATATSIFTDGSGSADDGPLECQVDADCGDFCFECISGSCEEYPGCCAPMPEDPWVWRCSPPEECFEDLDCPSGWVCDFGSCVPAPDPVIEQPPECKDVVELYTQSLDLGFVASQVLPWGGSGLLVVDQMGQLVPVDLVTGPGAPLTAFEGLPVTDVMAVNTSVIATRIDDFSNWYELLRARDEGGTWVTAQGEVVPGLLFDASVMAETSELVAVADDRIDRWSTDSLTVTEMFPFLGLRSITPLSLGPKEPIVFAGVSDEGLFVIDPATGGVIDQLAAPIGRTREMATGTFFLNSHGQDLAVLGSHQGEADGELMTVVSSYAVAEGTLSAIPPFGVPGEPRQLVVADVDHDGVDDVIVGVDFDRVELFLMEDHGVRCHVFLPVSSVVDLAGGDVDGDGTRDVVFSDADGGVTIVWGSAAPG